MLGERHQHGVDGAPMTDRLLRLPHLDVPVGYRDEVVRSSDIDLTGTETLSVLSNFHGQRGLVLHRAKEGGRGQAVLLPDRDDECSLEVVAETGEKLLKLIDQLNEHDDVQNVYANFEVSDALVAKMGG